MRSRDYLMTATPYCILTKTGLCLFIQDGGSLPPKAAHAFGSSKTGEVGISPRTVSE